MRNRFMPAAVAAALFATFVVTIDAGAVAAPKRPSPATAAHAAPADDYVALAPSRLYNTKKHTVLRPGQRRSVTVTGGDVPADASAVDLTVSSSGRAHGGTLSVEPCGTPDGKATVLQFVKGQSISNHVNAAVGTAGAVCVRATVTTDFQLDLDGYYPSASDYHPVLPTSVLATRVIGAAQKVKFKVASGSIPQNSSTVAFDVTSSLSAKTGRIVLWPCGQPRPALTSLSYPKLVSRIAFALSPLGTGGRVCAWASHTTDVAVVAVGYYAADASLHPVSGAKLAGASVAAHAVTHVKVTGRSSHVAVDARAVQLSIETTDQPDPGRLTLYACGNPKPTTTVLTYGPNDAIGDIAVTLIGVGGNVCITSTKAATLVVRLVGWYDNGTI